MNEKNLRLISIFALLISGAVTTWAMLRAADWQINPNIGFFVLWAISPYACFFLADSLLRKIVLNSKMYVVSNLIAILLLVATLILYVGTMNSESSTDSLKFLFVPICLYVGSFALLFSNFVFWQLWKKFQKQP